MIFPDYRSEILGPISMIHLDVIINKNGLNFMVTTPIKFTQSSIGQRYAFFAVYENQWSHAFPHTLYKSDCLNDWTQ